MLNKLHRLALFKACCGVLLLFFSLLILPAYAESSSSPTVTVPTAQNMITNLSTQIPNLMRMITAFAYVSGMYFMFIGLLKLKQYGESRTMMSHDRDLKGPVIFLAVGALLIYLPSTISIGLSTFWATPNPYAYLQSESQWGDLINICFLIIQFIGTIAFIRGLILLTHLGGQGGQPGTVNKAMSHIIGGILCINIYQFVQVIMVTLGIQT